MRMDRESQIESLQSRILSLKEYQHLCEESRVAMAELTKENEELKSQIDQLSKLDFSELETEACVEVDRCLSQPASENEQRLSTQENIAM
eukprot:6419284-Ditylum_brightwellii.AAC.1